MVRRSPGIETPRDRLPGLINLGLLVIMKHSEWQRLKVEGEKIVMALRAADYQCYQHHRGLSWMVRKGSISYRLTWLMAPLREWSLFPNDGSPEREQLLSQIRAIVEIHRGSSDPQTSSPPPLPSSSQSNDFWLQQNYPWMIIQLLPNTQRYGVARFSSRSEAERHQRFLSRFIANTEFEVVFDPLDG